MSDSEVAPITVTLSPKAASLLRVKSLAIGWFVTAPLFLVTVIGNLVATAIANNAYALYRVADYDAENIDALQDAWNSATNAAGVWDQLSQIAIPLFAAVVLGTIVIEGLRKYRQA